MQPIIILGLVAAVAITMSSGFLLVPNIDVLLQAVGFGSEIASDPVKHVSVDIDIDKQLVNPDALTTNLPGDEYYDNVITECSFHIAATDINDQNVIGDNTDDGVQEVICKLTENGVVKGEGSITFLGGGNINCVQTDNPNPPPATIDTQVAVQGYFCPSQHYAITNLAWADGTPATIQQWTDVLIVVRGQNPTNQLP